MPDASLDATEMPVETTEDGEMVEDGGIVQEISTNDELKESADALGLLRSEKDYQPMYKVEDLGLSLATVAYERYGFTGHPVDSGPPAEQMDWDTVRKLLGNGKWLQNAANEIFKETEELSDDVRNDLMRHLFLIGQTNPESFQNIPSLDLADPSNLIHSVVSWEFSVRKVQVDNEPWYLLMEKGASTSANHLLLRDPVAVVQIVRCNWGITASEVADQLITHGIQFHTLRKGRRPTVQEMQRFSHLTRPGAPRCILGYRRSDYKADTHDLHVYEAERDRFLRSSRGRATVMCGGIVGRIAREVVPDAHVIYGPDPDLVCLRGRCFLDTLSGGYWDDEITSEEIDLICGVYIVERGTFSLS